MTKKDGTLVSGREFNKLLTPLTANIVKPNGKRILSHSFRSGIPTLMARAGYQDHEIQKLGRWRSTAFLAYCKLGRASRWKDQLTLAKRISSLYIMYVRSTYPNTLYFQIIPHQMEMLALMWTKISLWQKTVFCVTVQCHFRQWHNINTTGQKTENFRCPLSRATEDPGGHASGTTSNYRVMNAIIMQNHLGE